MLSEDTNLWEFHQHQKSHKVPYTISTDLEYIIEKVDGCKKIILKIHLQQK